MRYIAHSIEASLQVKERHERRLEVLSKKEPSQETIDEIERIQDVLSNLQIEEYIKQSTTLEAVYMESINELEPLDKTIILDGFINGKPYWKIGQEIGFSIEGIKKRVKKIIFKLAKKI